MHHPYQQAVIFLKSIWLVDSGASFHTITYTALTTYEKSTITLMSQPIACTTASGEITTHTQQVPLYIQDLDIIIHAILKTHRPFPDITRQAS